MEKPILVIDSNVIIKHQDINNLQLKYDIYTVPSVISEIRDAKARTTLRELAFE
jgi:rRNA maturation endonuclease Nob1